MQKQTKSRACAIVFSMSTFFVFCLLFVGLVLIFLALSFFMRLWHLHFAPAPQKQMRTQTDERGDVIFVRCPLCNTPLAKDENLVSRIFRPMTTPDQRMHVMGCPHCYPVVQNGIQRTCPVCKKAVASEDYLVARLFNKPGKKHVIVTGCTHCIKVN